MLKNDQHQIQRQIEKSKRRVEKAAAKSRKHVPVVDTSEFTAIDCACVIHGTGYDWLYVERLYNMLKRNISLPIRFHVYTEADRPVPEHMIKHVLEEWGAGGPRRAWWHKIQMFNSEHHAGHLLYFDLDTVITSNIDWLWQSDPRFFWTIKDFKRLWQTDFVGINSSIMWWDTRHWSWIWQEFKRQDFVALVKRYHGDQDYLTVMVDQAWLRYYDTNRILSYRWQALDGGFDFVTRRHQTPGTGLKLNPDVSALIFHGNPKPHKANNPVVEHYWR